MEKMRSSARARMTPGKRRKHPQNRTITYLTKAGEETADAEPEEAGEGEGLKAAKSLTYEVLTGNLYALSRDRLGRCTLFVGDCTWERPYL
jgi:hypothetical protein